jgi:hypothetical protein
VLGILGEIKITDYTTFNFVEHYYIAVFAAEVAQIVG